MSGESNFLTEELNVPRKRNNGLVVPCVYRATITHSGIAETLHMELVKASESCGHMDINENDSQLKKKVCF